MDYDVIIVGAGPAGSAAAIPLAQAGQKVLIVDSSEFPREKPCGDAILPVRFKFWKNWVSSRK